MYYFIGIGYRDYVKKLAYENGIYYFTDNLFEALKFNDEEECIDFLEENISYETFRHWQKTYFGNSIQVCIFRVSEVIYDRISTLKLKKEGDLE